MLAGLILKIWDVIAARRLLFLVKVLTRVVLFDRRVTTCTLTRSQLVARRALRLGLMMKYLWT